MRVSLHIMYSRNETRLLSRGSESLALSGFKGDALIETGPGPTEQVRTHDLGVPGPRGMLSKSTIFDMVYKLNSTQTIPSPISPS